MSAPDVFGLRRPSLCEILTGKPPFTRKTSEVMDRARTADLADALFRLDACAADAGLRNLAKRCLAAEASRRLANASEVARAVGAYRASVQERLSHAERQRAAEHARAEEAVKKAAAERRARRLLLGLTATVVLLLLAAGAWQVQQQRQRRLSTDQQTLLALEKSGHLLEDARLFQVAEQLDKSKRGLRARLISEKGHRKQSSPLRELRARCEQMNVSTESVLRQVVLGAPARDRTNSLAEVIGRCRCNSRTAREEMRVAQRLASIPRIGLRGSTRMPWTELVRVRPTSFAVSSNCDQVAGSSSIPSFNRWAFVFSSISPGMRISPPWKSSQRTSPSR